MKKIFALSLLGFWAVSGFAKDKESNKPLSNQASFVESYSSSEVTIKATGIGVKAGWFKDEDKNAILDGRKSAVWFVLAGGTDPLLNSPDAKAKFDAMAEEFFTGENVNAYITWEADKVIDNLKTTLPNGDKGRKITKMYRVNKQKLSDDLATKGVIVSQAALAEAQGMPNLMVIPETPKGQTPIEVLDKNPIAKHAAAVIESYLTARQYDVVVPRAMEQLSDMTNMQAQIKGAEEDVAYQIALSLGSDVYIVYAGQVENGKASVSVKAYETTTARLLGTETGYSKTRAGSPAEPLVEEAIHDAIDKVLQRVTAYWTADLQKGLQYKLVFKILATFDEDKTEDIQDAISGIVKSGFPTRKENIVTDKTMDYNVWAKKDQFESSGDIYKFVRDKMKGKAKLKKINLNRKLIIVGIGEE